MSSLLQIIRSEVSRATRVVRAVRRGTLGTGAGSNYTAQVQGVEGETWEKVELWQQYGLASRPPAGGEAAVMEMDGAGEGAVVVATQDRTHRPSTEADETVLYGKKGTGQPTVRLQSSGKIIIENGGGAIAATITLAAAGGIDIEATTGTNVNVSGLNINLDSAGFANVGSFAAVDFSLKGTTFHGAFSTLAPFITAWLNALTPIFAEWKTASSASTPWVPVSATQDALKTANDALIASGASAAWPLFLGTMTMWLATKARVF